MERPTHEEIEKARETLRKAGYFVDTLWSIYDVQSQFECDDDEIAQEVLSNALTNEWIMEQIWYGIRDAAENENLKPAE